MSNFGLTRASCVIQTVCIDRTAALNSFHDDSFGKDGVKLVDIHQAVVAVSNQRGAAYVSPLLRRKKKSAYETMNIYCNHAYMLHHR